MLCFRKFVQCKTSSTILVHFTYSDFESKQHTFHAKQKVTFQDQICWVESPIICLNEGIISATKLCSADKSLKDSSILHLAIGQACFGEISPHTTLHCQDTGLESQGRLKCFHILLTHLSVTFFCVDCMKGKMAVGTQNLLCANSSTHPLPLLYLRQCRASIKMCCCWLSDR